MNKLKFLFLFWIFASAPEPETATPPCYPDFVCEKSACIIDLLLEGYEQDEAAQGLVSANQTQYFFKRRIVMKQGMSPVGNSWKLVGFGVGGNFDFKTMLEPLLLDYNKYGDIVFKVDHLGYQFYSRITKVSEIPTSVRTNIDPCDGYVSDPVKGDICLPILKYALQRLAYDRGLKNFILSINKKGMCAIHNTPKDKTEYTPTLLSPSRLKALKSLGKFTGFPKKFKIPGLGIWFDVVNPVLPSEFYFVPIRLNEAPTKWLRCLVMIDLDESKSNFSYVCNWFGVTDYSKGLYLDHNGKISPAKKIPSDIPLFGVNDDIDPALKGKKFQCAWIFQTQEGEIKIAIKATETKDKEEPMLLEEQPAEEVAEQIIEELLLELKPSSPGSGSSTDAPAVVVAAPEPELKIVIPQAAFESGLTISSDMHFPLPNKRPKKDKILTIEGQLVYAAKEARPKGCLSENQLTLLVRRFSEGKNFSGNMQVKDLKNVIKTLNEYLKELNISAIEEDHPAMVGNAQLMFALYEGNLCFGIGKNATQAANKVYTLRGGKPLSA